MQVTPLSTIFMRLAVIVLLAICGACQTPEPEPDNRYQRTIDNAGSAVPALPEPLRQLHNQALAAINEGQYALAADYLQRAIRIAPRNGWSWYYLADVDWRQGDHEHCRSMLDRADAYALDDASLAQASAELRTRCR